MPRIISGKCKGFKISAPTGRDVRPTADRVKESIFNILMPLISGANVLDMFAGSGSLGLEALSRGAEFCMFIESSKRTAKIIRANITLCKEENNSRLICGEAFSVLKKNAGIQFDLIFLDPPYRRGLIKKSISEICVLDLLSNDGIIVAEHPVDEEKHIFSELDVYRSVRYGTISVSFLRKKGYG